MGQQINQYTINRTTFVMMIIMTSIIGMVQHIKPQKLKVR